MSAEGPMQAKPETVSDFLVYVEGRQTLPNDFYPGKKGYWNGRAYLEDLRLIKESRLSPQEQLEVLNSMSGMMSVLGTAAVDEGSA